MYVHTHVNVCVHIHAHMEDTAPHLPVSPHAGHTLAVTKHKQKRVFGFRIPELPLGSEVFTLSREVGMY